MIGLPRPGIRPLHYRGSRSCAVAPEGLINFFGFGARMIPGTLISATSPSCPMARREEAARAIIRAILDGRVGSRDELDGEKRRISRELGLAEVPSSSFVLSRASPEERGRVLPLLMLKPTRTASGVAVVAVQTSPSQTCPGSCIYCPDFPGASKSYTGREPASMRAIQCDHDPRLQVSSRLGQLSSMGHPISKVELIVQGATFPAMDLEYRRWFVARCLDALSSHSSGARPQRTLSEAIRSCERSRVRPVGLTYETRPDWCDEESVSEMLSMGATRIEVGVQVLSERVYAAVARGHGLAEVAGAFRALRSAGLKICAHMMLGLPGSDAATDLESFRTLFRDPRYRPDEVKIYPTLVIPGTRLHRMWQDGRYVPLTDGDVMEMLIRIKAMVPPWVRIKRIMRDIPSTVSSAGPGASDMRNRLALKMGEMGICCRCTRCREVSRSSSQPGRLMMRQREYAVDGGRELFLSMEDDRERLAAFLRLSVSSDGQCTVREVHTYGRSVSVGSRPSVGEYQHRGLGRRLLSTAERIARREAGARELRVTSGIGVRDYYRSLGYRLSGSHMFKEIR
jgi:elongator complex protein 3